VGCEAPHPQRSEDLSSQWQQLESLGLPELKPKCKGSGTNDLHRLRAAEQGWQGKSFGNLQKVKESSHVRRHAKSQSFLQTAGRTRMSAASIETGFVGTGFVVPACAV
jgi:hypothetical protein